MYVYSRLRPGYFRLQGQVVIDSVSTGLELGYRVTDTAQIYANEAEVGQAIAASGIPREELFITSKIRVANFAKDTLIDSLKESLRKLQTNYLDLTLIHWPSPQDQVPVAEFMGALPDTGSGVPWPVAGPRPRAPVPRHRSHQGPPPDVRNTGSSGTP